MVHRAMEYPELSPIIEGSQALWIPPFIMAVLGDQRTFAALAPALALDADEKPTKFTHILSGLGLLKTAYLKPGDGSYAQPLREALETQEVDPDLVGQMLSWHLTILSKVAHIVGKGELNWKLAERAIYLGTFAGAAPDSVYFNSKAMREHFNSVAVDDAMRKAFWEIMAQSALREITSEATDQQLLTQCGLQLPVTFIHQFKRT